MKEIIAEIDEILRDFEDVMHGIEGENCTKARSLLIKLEKQLILYAVRHF